MPEQNIITLLRVPLGRPLTNRTTVIAKTLGCTPEQLIASTAARIFSQKDWLLVAARDVLPQGEAEFLRRFPRVPREHAWQVHERLVTAVVDCSYDILRGHVRHQTARKCSESAFKRAGLDPDVFSIMVTYVMELAWEVAAAVARGAVASSTSELVSQHLQAPTQGDDNKSRIGGQ